MNRTSKNDLVLFYKSSYFSKKYLDELTGLRRVLNETLGMERTVQVDWEIEPTCLGTWFRPSFEPCLFPYIPSHVKTPKERRQIFLG